MSQESTNFPPATPSLALQDVTSQTDVNNTQSADPICQPMDIDTTLNDLTRLRLNCEPDLNLNSEIGMLDLHFPVF